MKNKKPRTPMTPEQKREMNKKVLLFLPLIAVPLLTLAFVAMGGGGGGQHEGHQVTQEQSNFSTGINSDLPAAKSGGLPQSKLDAYVKADRDSIESMNRSLQEDRIFVNLSRADTTEGKGTLNTSASATPARDTALEDLAISVRTFQNNRNNTSQHGTDGYQTPSDYYNSGPSSEVQLQEKIISSQMKQLDYARRMDSINYERMLHGEKKKEDSLTMNQEIGYEPDTDAPDLRPKTAVVTSLYSTNTKRQTNDFYGIGSGRSNTTELANSIPATIFADQVIITGSPVKLRLLAPLQVPTGEIIPANQFINGVAAIGSNRMEIAIKTVEYNGSIFPVKLAVYDMDGMAGINLPESVNRQIAKQSLGASASGSNTNLSVSTSVGQQVAMSAAQAGIKGLENVMKRKATTVRVHLKAGYQILLVPVRTVQAKK